jgi:hypothetical protein
MDSSFSLSLGRRRIAGVVVSLIAGILFAITPGHSFGADTSPIANIDSSLQHLLDQNATKTGVNTAAQPNTTVSMPGSRLGHRLGGGPRFDSQARVLVHIHLDGSESLSAVEAALGAYGVTVLDHSSTYRHGIIAAYAPLGQLASLAKQAGIRALTMEHRPETRVGSVTSEGTVVLQTNKVNKLGFRGEGITIGALSDSFNTAQFNTASPPATTAAQDVQTGDLPVVNVIQDLGGPAQPGTDEGRAMLQVVYDCAPKSNLAFATAFVSEVGFANNIVNLRVQANCDVICDDVTYFDEPVFSDGILAQAVNTVVQSTTLPGKQVVYASSAGNDANNGYRSAYRPISDSVVRSQGYGNLQLSQVPKALTAAGWHNWNPNGGFEPATTVSVPTIPADGTFQYAIFMQWDDPFDESNGITNDYNFLVFDQDGNYHPELSGTSNAFGLQQPIQAIGELLNNTTYQIAITESKKKAGSPASPSTHQLAFYTTLDGAGDLTGPYFHYFPLDVPTIIGHPAADSAIAVAAYVYDWTDTKNFQPQIEDYTSPGPTIIYFDGNQNRLSSPETRLKPEVAAVDGVGTTFFGGPYESNQFSFFGTSCAAPHIAGVAALIVQAAGGPGKITPAEVKGLLEETAPPRDVDPLFSSALAASSSGFVSVTSQGSAQQGANFFTVSFIGGSGQSMNSLTLNGKNAGLVYNTASPNYVPELGTLVGIAASDVTIVPNPGSGTNKLTLTFTPGAFTSGVSVSFRVKPEVKIEGADGSSADSEAGVTFNAKFGGSFTDKVIGTFQNTFSTGISNPNNGALLPDGFGLVNAFDAVELLLSSDSKKKP